MPTIKLTKTALEDIEPAERDTYFWDSDIKGFGVKVTPKGRKVFLVQYRLGGRDTPTRKITIGEFGSITVYAARNEAQRINGQRAEGRDPAEERKRAKQRIASDRFSSIAEDFLEKHASQNRTIAETTRILRRDVLSRWGTRSIHNITKLDVNDLLDSIVERGSPIMANRTLAAIRKLFNWCVSRGIMTLSPCDGVSAPQKEKARDRVLDDEELVAVLRAAEQIGGPYGGIVTMLVLTGQREREVSRMTWDELRPETATWTIPQDKSKNGKSHDVHLSAPTVRVLASMPHIGEFVFTSNGRTPFSGFSNAKKRLDERSGVTDWRLHDIRRTVTSGMARLGVAPHVADKILNHQSGTISGVAAVYQRHEFLEEREQALDRWGAHVQVLMAPT